MSDFFDGLVRPSLTALITTCLVVVSGLSVFVVLARPAMLAPWTLLPTDDDGWTTAMMANPTPGARVALLGSSGTRESIDHGVFTEAIGGPFLNLTANSQSLLGTVALAEHLPDTVDTVLIGVSAVRFSYGDDHLDRIVRQPNIGFFSEQRADELQEEFGRTEPHTGLLAIDRRVFYLYWLARLPRAGLKGFPGEWTTNRYRHKDRRDAPAEKLARLLRGQREFQAAHLRILGRLIDRLTKAGRRVLLVASPVCAPKGIEHLDTMRALFEQGMTEFLIEHPVPFLRLDEEAALKCEEFENNGHLRSKDAQSRYARALAARLGER